MAATASTAGVKAVIMIDGRWLTEESASENYAEPYEVPGTPSNEELLALADAYPPPPEWYEEEDDEEE